MGLLFIVAMFVSAAASLFAPWIGVLYGYLFVVLDPQDIWYWDFTGWRPVFLVLVPTCVGFLFAVVRRKVSLGIVRNRRNFYLLVLWIFVVISYYFGPYTQAGGPYRWDNAQSDLSVFGKIYLLYFIACICIDSERKLRAMFYMFVLSAMYLVYWANRQYLTGHYFGRLNGPTALSGHGNYEDQNSFAMLFVVAQSFLWYFGFSFRRPLWRWLSWLWIPFSWHAVFLTGSRGGLLGLGATTVLIGIRSKKKALGLALIPALLLVFIWQGGSVMKDRAVTIDHYKADGSAEGRLQSWRAAIRMIVAHPITGVGLASYGPAFPHYSDNRPREAHDTFLQIAAESGLVAGTMYALIVGTSLILLWRNGNKLKDQKASNATSLWLINEAVLIGYCGLVVCSLFLSLQRFEIFYLLNVLTNAVLYLSSKRASAIEPKQGRLIKAELGT